MRVLVRSAIQAPLELAASMGGMFIKAQPSDSKSRIMVEGWGKISRQKKRAGALESHMRVVESFSGLSPRPCVLCQSSLGGRLYGLAMARTKKAGGAWPNSPRDLKDQR
jgi:hypothetical protein